MALGLIGNLQLPEIVIIATVAILIFGKRLPAVAAQAAGHFAKARRSLEELWRESGLEREVSTFKREVDQVQRSLPSRLSLGDMARKATSEAWKDIEAEATTKGDTVPAPVASEPLPGSVPRTEPEPRASGPLSDAPVVSAPDPVSERVTEPASETAAPDDASSERPRGGPAS